MTRTFEDKAAELETVPAAAPDYPREMFAGPDDVRPNPRAERDRLEAAAFAKHEGAFLEELTALTRRYALKLISDGGGTSIENLTVAEGDGHYEIDHHGDLAWEKKGTL